MVACAGEGGALEQVGANGCGAEAGAGGGSGRGRGNRRRGAMPRSTSDILGRREALLLAFPCERNCKNSIMMNLLRNFISVQDFLTNATERQRCIRASPNFRGKLGIG